MRAIHAGAFGGSGLLDVAMCFGLAAVYVSLGVGVLGTVLDLSDRIREMILARRPASEVKKAAHEEGMRFLRESAIEKVLKGMTTLKEINKVTFVE